MRESSRKYSGALSFAAFAAVILVLGMRGASLINVPGEPDFHRWVLQDFRDSTYYSVVSFLSGGNPYDVEAYRTTYPVLQRFSPYSPHFLLLHVPFGLLSHQSSQIVFFVFTMVLTTIVAYLTLTMCGTRPTPTSVFALAAMILASRPGQQNLLVGQTTLEMVIGFYVAHYFWRTSPWISAMGVVVALQKVTFGLPLVVFMLWQRRSRPVLLGLALTIAADSIVVFSLANAAGGLTEVARSMWTVLRGAGANVTSHPVLSFARIDAVALVGRVLETRPGLFIATCIFLVVIGLACAALSRVGDLVCDRAADRYRIGVVCLATLVGTYHQSYSALLLVLPLTALILDCWRPMHIRSNSWERPILIALLAIPFLNYLSTTTVLSYLEPNRGEWRFLTSINGAALLLAFAIYSFLPFRRSSVCAEGERLPRSKNTGHER